MTPRTDAPDTSWAGDLGADDDQPRQRRSGMDREVDPTSYDPGALVAELGPRGGTGGTPAQVTNFDDLGERPSWHSAATPAPVAAAWSAVVEAVEAAVEADRLERALGGQEAQAQREEAARVRAAVASGRTVKAAAPGRDFPAERRHSAAVAAGLRLRARKCREAYDLAVQEHREGWAALLVETLPSSKAQAIEALADAGERVGRLLEEASAAQALQLEPGGSVSSLPLLEVNRFVQAAQTLAGTIEASDQLGGEAMVRPPMSPPYRDREAVGVALLHGVVDSGTFWLAEIERREQFRLTSWTRGVPLGERPSEVTAW